MIALYLACPRVNKEESEFAIKLLVTASSLIIIIVVISHFSFPSRGHNIVGRRLDGLYFSTIYIFTTVLLIGYWMYDVNILPGPILYFALGLHLARLLIDLRRSPLMTVLLGTMGMLLLFLFMSRIRRGMSVIHSVKQKMKIAFSSAGIILLTVVVSLMFSKPDVINPGTFGMSDEKTLKRFRLEKLERGFERRKAGWSSALADAKWNPITGKGLGSSFDLPHSRKIHSLYVFLIAHMGMAGIVLFLTIIISTFSSGIRAAYRTKDAYVFGNCLAISASFICYVCFLAFSVRGTQFDAMTIFSFAGWILSNFSGFERLTS